MKRSSKNRSVHGEFRLSLGGLFEHIKRLFPFLALLIKEKLKSKKQDCKQTYLYLVTNNYDRQLSSTPG